MDTTAPVRDGRRRWILALDTATAWAVVAAAREDGQLIGITTWPAGYRHGEQLLPSIGRLTGEQNLRRSRIAAIVAGTGPGAFTGLRVGLATAKALAHALHVPIVGVATSAALIAAARRVAGAEVALMLPAGPADRVLCRAADPPVLLPGGREPTLRPGERLAAVDLDGRAPVDAVALGEDARVSLAAELVRLGVERLSAGDADDLARLAPEYVSLPRGVTTAVPDDAVAVSAESG